MHKKLDALAFAAHPDDIEFSCAGTLIKLRKQGYRVGIIEFTAGEMGSNGNPAERLKECGAAAKVMGVNLRENLRLRDAYLQADDHTVREVVRKIRAYRPDLIIASHFDDQHPDHAAVGRAVEKAVFYSGLIKYKTGQEKFRPRQVVFNILGRVFEPSFIVDVTSEFEQRQKAAACHRSQLYGEKKVKTAISSPEFLEHLAVRARYYGSLVGCRYGEAFFKHGPLKINEVMKIL
jgi:bacillithiol biosynthesis deacetylase BshB1